MAQRTALLLALAFSVAPCVARAEKPSPLNAAVRERLDRQALGMPADTVGDEIFRSFEQLPLSLLDAAGMTPEEEAQCAADAAAGRPALPTPATAQRVFDRLVAELPPHLKAHAFRYRLTVLDLPDNVAFTDGGGLVSVSRPWIDALLADPERGEAALAFVLAGEIGHVALGHTRRGWELREAAAGVAEYAPLPPPRRLCTVGAGGFAYTAADRYAADRFALHLCRNAGFDCDAALDGLRLLAARKDDKGDIQLAHFTGDGGPRAAAALDRLKRLLQERDGLYEDEAKYGLFLFDRARGRLERSGAGQVGRGRAPIILVHGLRGNEYALADYLFFLAGRPEVAGRPLLAFRYPNNGSLSRAGQLLTREMRRCVAEPEKAVFVCHSAGGLVFRWYAEVRAGGFDRAVFLAVPHAGADTAEFVGLVDVGRFALDLPVGLGHALDDAFDEGDGQIARDLRPDSLFLRRLGRGTPPVERYRIFYGQFLDWTQALQVQLAFAAAKQYATEAVTDLVPFPTLRTRLTRLVETAPLPEGVTRGDLVVSARSARLPGVAHTEALPLQHEAFRYDPELIRHVLDAILEQ